MKTCWINGVAKKGTVITGNKRFEICSSIKYSCGWDTLSHNCTPPLTAKPLTSHMAWYCSLKQSESRHCKQGRGGRSGTGCAPSALPGRPAPRCRAQSSQDTALRPFIQQGHQQGLFLLINCCWSGHIKTAGPIIWT